MYLFYEYTLSTFLLDYLYILGLYAIFMNNSPLYFKYVINIFSESVMSLNCVGYFL